jgi:phosphopantothenoylcysteine decarboxylase/phosphopantothenate--cysteine ligase
VHVVGVHDDERSDRQLAAGKLAGAVDGVPGRVDLAIGDVCAAGADQLQICNRAAGNLRRCNWIVANDVSGDVMGGADNEVMLITKTGAETWPRMAKDAVARKLAAEIAAALAGKPARKK